MIGFSCPPLAVRPFGEAAKMVVPHFRHWEIVSEADHWLPDIRDEVRELLETTDMGFSIHGPYSDMNLAAFDSGTRKHTVNTFLDIINICAEMGIGPVTVHPGVIGPIQHWDRPRVSKLTRASLEVLAREAGDNSVLIALENMPEMKYTTCRTAQEMEDMLEGLDIGMCFDIGHAHTADQMAGMIALRERFINVHVHDNSGDRDAHLPLGQGTVELRMLRELTRYKGNFIIEAKSTDMEKAVASKRFLEDILP